MLKNIIKLVSEIDKLLTKHSSSLIIILLLICLVLTLRLVYLALLR